MDDPARSLPSLMLDALVYPWRDSGWMFIVSGGVLLLLISAANANALGWISLGALGGYLAAHYFNVIETTLSGRRTQPHWPELTGDLWGDVLGPALRIFAIHAIATLPAALLAAWQARQAPGWQPAQWLGWTALAFHCLYLPLAAVAVALTGDLIQALPHRVLPAILRGGPSYLAGAAMLFAMLAAVRVVSGLLAALPWAGGFLVLGVIMWTLLFQARFCGLLYRHCQERIGWC